MNDDPNPEPQTSTPTEVDSTPDWTVRDAAVQSLTSEQARLQNLLMEAERQLRLVKHAMSLQPGRIVATKSPRRHVRVVRVVPLPSGLGVGIRVQDGSDEITIDVSELDPG